MENSSIWMCSAHEFLIYQKDTIVWLILNCEEKITKPFSGFFVWLKVGFYCSIERSVQIN